MASVDPGAVQQRLFEELTSEEGVSGMTSTHSSPLQFCNSPIMIHGSSSEEEDGDQHGPVRGLAVLCVLAGISMDLLRIYVNCLELVSAKYGGWS